MLLALRYNDISKLLMSCISRCVCSSSVSSAILRVMQTLRKHKNVKTAAGQMARNTYVPRYIPNKLPAYAFAYVEILCWCAPTRGCPTPTLRLAMLPLCSHRGGVSLGMRHITIHLRSRAPF